MHETLHEYCHWPSGPLRVDRDAGVIRGVKILGPESRNGRTYPPETLAAACALYEQAKVNVNHGRLGPQAPRDYQDRIGVIRHVRVRSHEGLFADFYFNPKHALAEQLAWDAEHAAENVGFSHNVEARTSRRGERVVVEEILKVQSVDLVADPATTRGLFEAAEPSAQAGDDSAQAAAAPSAGTLSLEALRTERPDLVAALEQPFVAERRRLQEELDHWRRTADGERRQALIRQLLSEAQLPPPETTDPLSRTIVSASFLASLAEAADDDTVRQLVAERARLVGSTRAWVTARLAAAAPVAREQQAAAVPLDVNDVGGFVRAIT